MPQVNDGEYGLNFADRPILPLITRLLVAKQRRAHLIHGKVTVYKCYLTMVQRDDANLYLRIGVNVSSDTSIKQCAIGHKPLQAQSSYLCIFIIGLYFAFLCF